MQTLYGFFIQRIPFQICKKNLSVIPRTGLITAKKNAAVSMAKNDKCCVMHDYFALTPGWLQGFKEFGDDWEVCTNRIELQDGRRHYDWTTWDFPGIGHALFHYDYHCPYLFISGGYFCVKRLFILKNPLNEALFWGMSEDVEWSLRVRKKTKFRFNSRSMAHLLKEKKTSETPYCEAWEKKTADLNQIMLSKKSNYEITKNNIK
jgi:hypothetical protein